MSDGKVVELRPQITDTFVCPCGSMWFSTSSSYSTTGRHLERRPVATCDGCGRKHHLDKKEPR